MFKAFLAARSRLPAALVAAALATGTAAADSAPDRDAVAWKFTPTLHDNRISPNAWDFNVRGNTETQTWWLGYYERRGEFRQARLGYERPVTLPYARIVPSLQYASRGFWGGSLYSEIGGDAFGILGWGRTNLKDYYNLNFDPNDALTFGAGFRPSGDSVISLSQVRDDRLRTGQRVTHLVARFKPDQRTRVTLDIFRREGRPDPDPTSARVRATGAGVTIDVDRWFARITRDPHVNFSDDSMVRVAFGFRF